MSNVFTDEDLKELDEFRDWLDSEAEIATQAIHLALSLGVNATNGTLQIATTALLYPKFLESKKTKNYC